MMHVNEQAVQRGWSSLSLRLSAVFVAVLVTSAFAVGYLFDRERSEAMQSRALERLRLHAERGADEVERFVLRLQGDVLFLSRTPPVQGIRRALEGGGLDTAGNSTLDRWRERLHQIFLAFAEARPQYFQIRLIGGQDGGRELVRVERTGAGSRIVPREELQRKGERYYFQYASVLSSGSVYLSRVDLNRERGRISVPHLPTLRALTPVYDRAGNFFGTLVVNMDMGWVFDRAESFRIASESAYIADEHGDILLHPEPDRAFGFEVGSPFRLVDAFPGQGKRISDVLSGGGGFVEVPAGSGESTAYVTERAWDPADHNRRMVYILTEPLEQVFQSVGLKRRDSMIAMAGLLLPAIILVVVTVRRLTRSLGALARASRVIAGGNYHVALPAAGGGEVGSLVLAFRRMAAEVKRREDALAELNRDLEQRVKERMHELAGQDALQKLILENIADGIVVCDRDGRFLLWNRKAEQITGAGPEDVAPGRWSSHFGIFRDEEGNPVPLEDMPLFRALQGQSSDNVELYVRNPARAAGRWVQVTARPLHDADGSIYGGVAVLVDVTEQRRLQGRIQAHRAKLAEVGRLALSAEIASSTAHQLSQPIAAISNYAGAAVRMQQQGRLEGAELSDILTTIERLAARSGGILDKLRAGIRRRDRPLMPIDVNQVVMSCLDLLNERIERQRVSMERRLGAGLPMLIGDSIELEQLLIQLVSNALDAMEGIVRDERRLSVRTHYEAEGDLVVIEVGDTGPGVSAELEGRLFEPWETDKPGALGIGLSIAHTFVESLGGRILMERGKAGGALFRVELPVAREGQG